MPDNIESQAEYILDEIITEDQKIQAVQDVRNIESSIWNQARLLVELLDKIGTELKKNAVIRAVANLYGVSDTTIKGREKPARMFQPNLIDAHPLLTFSYWKTAAYANHMDEPLESALDIIWQIYGHWDAYGKRPSVQTVEAWVRHGPNTIKTVWMMRAEGVVGQMDKIQADNTAPQELRDLMGWERAMLSSYLETGISPLMGGPTKGAGTVIESSRKEATPTIGD